MPYLLCRMQKSLGRTLLTRSMTSQLRKMSLRSPKLRSERYVQRLKHSLKLPSYHRLVNSDPGQRQPPLSLHRRKQSRLRVVPRRLNQLMRGRKTEIYLACDLAFNVSDPGLRCSASPLLSACYLLLYACCRVP
jgi:hypothetical protein